MFYFSFYSFFLQIVKWDIFLYSNEFFFPEKWLIWCTKWRNWFEILRINSLFAINRLCAVQTNHKYKLLDEDSELIGMRLKTDTQNCTIAKSVYGIHMEQKSAWDEKCAWRVLLIWRSEKINGKKTRWWILNVASQHFKAQVQSFFFWFQIQLKID